MNFRTDSGWPMLPQHQNGSQLPPKRRAAVACRTCNQRKVRCNVSVSNGAPCSNCVTDGCVCEIVPRKKRRARKLPPDPKYDSQTDAVNIESPRPLETETASLQSSSQIFDQRGLSTDPVVLEDGIAGQITVRNGVERDEGDNSHAFAFALDPVAAPAGDATLFYSGDKSSTLGFLGDICQSQGPPRDSYYLVPRTSKRAQSLEDLSYLRSKGALSVPSKELCDELICSYFRHVHPLVPIVDAQSFLQEYVEHGYHNINLLLLWSMFFAAANSVDANVLRNSGYSTRKAMKRVMYQRAKCLYDSDYEPDQLSLIQSVILLGFWYTDTEDRTGAWHWIGIAISLCQTLGLHRSPESIVVTSRVSKRRRCLFRRIWWACFIRDRWLALAKGRPMRIHLDDCDVPLPVIDDVVQDLDAVPAATRDRYLPYPSHAMARLWLKLVRISVVLGNILRRHYRHTGARQSDEEIWRSEEELQDCALGEEDTEQNNPVLHVFAYQLQLFYEAAVVVLYRPYLWRTSLEDVAESQSVLQGRALDRAKAAAGNTNKILEECINKDIVSLFKPMTITCLMPAMQIHLLDCKSTNPLSRKLGNLKFQLCMLILSELRETYWGADFAYRMFERAHEKLVEMSETRDQPKQLSVVHENTADTLAGPLTPESTAISQVRSTNQAIYSYPSMDSILGTAFPLANMDYSFWTDELGVTSGAESADNLGLNSSLSSEQFNGFFVNGGA